ncbi:unnamed protein product [Rhizophagus irregularis]|nr:unnamed protein product [Rhizophagus irregularis]
MFSQFYNSISKPNLIISKHNPAGISFNITLTICGPNANCFYKLNYDKYIKCEMANEIPLKYIDLKPLDCSRYSSYHYNDIEIAISSSITSVHLDGLEMDKYYQSDVDSYSSNLIYHSKEQTTVIYYSPTIIKRILKKYAYGLAGGERKEYVNFNVHTDTLDLKTSNGTTLILRPTSPDIYYQEETFYDLSSIISSVGGFFSSLSGIYVFLFGASKLAPWGFLQTSVFNCLCTGYRREFVRKLKNRYEPIPFVSGRIKNVTLEERVQSIEKLLEEYYLDTDFLNLLLEDNCEKEISSESPRSTPEVVDDEIDDKVEIITAA